MNFKKSLSSFYRKLTVMILMILIGAGGGGFLSHGTALSAGVGILFSRSFNHFNAVQIRKRVVHICTSLYENDCGLHGDQPPTRAPVDSTGAAPGPEDNAGLKRRRSSMDYPWIRQRSAFSSGVREVRPSCMCSGSTARLMDE